MPICEAGPLLFDGDRIKGWQVYDRGENYCGSVYMRGTWAWFEADKQRQPLCVREVKALLLFMEIQEREAKV